MPRPTDTTPMVGLHPALHNAVHDVRMYGGVGDGSADDTAAFNSAVSAMSAGETLYIPATPNGYKLTDSVNISKAMRIVSNGAKLTQTGTSKKGLYITASNVSVNGLYLAGRQFATATATEHAIHAKGTDGTAPITNVEVRDCRIENWGFYGILLEYVTDFEVARNRVKDVSYGGIVGLSVIHGVIGQNRVANITPGSGGNAYGIAVSRNTTDSLTTDPHAEDITIIGNEVRDIPIWEGLDTHAGIRIAFIGNTIYNTKYGIALGAANMLTGSVPTWAPKGCSVIGNTLDSGVTDGSRQAGINFTGALGSAGSPTDLATGTIIGNSITGHGDIGSYHSAGLYIAGTQGVTVQGNELFRCSSHGINVYQDDYGFNVSGNTVVDPWNNAQGDALGLHISTHYNTGYIGGNSWVRGSLAGKTYMLTTGVRIDGSTGCDVTVGTNYNQAATYMYDPNNVIKTGFYSHAPAARAAAYTVTNPTTDRGLNVTGDTLAQVAQVVGTLIADLQAYGLLQ